MVKGRHSTGLDQWLDEQPAAWTEAVKVSVTDLHPPFRRTLAKHLPNATAVADPLSCGGPRHPGAGPDPPGHCCVLRIMVVSGWWARLAG